MTRNAFTLIEVLIAAIILALGTLGLLVLFAGAATQQRDATETTTSVIASTSAASILERRFANIDAANDATGNPGPELACISDGLWYALPTADTDPPDTNDPDFGAFTIDPDLDRDLYFVLNRPDTTILYQPDALTSNLAGKGGYNNTQPGSSDIDVFNEGTVADFPDNRIQPTSLSTITVITDDAPNVNPANRIGPDLITYRRVDKFNPPPAPTVPFSLPINGWTTLTPGQRSNFELYTPQGVLPGPANPSHIVLDLQNTNVADLRADDFARVRAFHIDEVENTTPAATRIVRSIIADPYTYESDTAISLTDRIRKDPRGIPSMGYSILFRSSPLGIPELGVFTYAIRPQQPNPENRFLPNEAGTTTNPCASNFGRPNDDAPLRAVDAELAWDDNLEQYFITTNDQTTRWATNPGQIILVADGPTVATPTGTENLAGSDIPVRVVAQRIIDNETRGYLDRVPRSNGRPMLATRSGAREEIEILAIQPVITDLVNNTWRLEPRAFETFPIKR